MLLGTVVGNVWATVKDPTGIVIHRGAVTRGRLRKGDTLTLLVDAYREEQVEGVDQNLLKLEGMDTQLAAKLAEAEATLRRIRGLHTEGVASPQDLDQAQAGAAPSTSPRSSQVTQTRRWWPAT